MEIVAKNRGETDLGRVTCPARGPSKHCYTSRQRPDAQAAKKMCLFEVHPILLASSETKTSTFRCGEIWFN